MVHLLVHATSHTCNRIFSSKIHTPTPLPICTPSQHCPVQFTWSRFIGMVALLGSCYLFPIHPTKFIGEKKKIFSCQTVLMRDMEKSHINNQSAISLPHHDYLLPFFLFNIDLLNISLEFHFPFYFSCLPWTAKDACQTHDYLFLFSHPAFFLQTLAFYD